MHKPTRPDHSHLRTCDHLKLGILNYFKTYYMSQVLDTFQTYTAAHKPGLDLKRWSLRPSELLQSMGCDSLSKGQDPGHGAIIVPVTTFILSISGHGGTQGPRGGLRVEGQQDTVEPF